ncbi:hypothetical protein BAE44_0018504 [Dichanthelium oligosanthes]|uniref:KIB1-4 beta-propeller domain-containing protein n=1 Tax=Dichanthelium oligosanthes TaxID=888268 RepID=A0A1E5V657_9POAL|nr:hypothetical protein BAE44_0018504 [Dichanthelium oligosanthes]
MGNMMAHQIPSFSCPREEALCQRYGDVEAMEEAEEPDQLWQDIPHDIAHHILHRVGSLAGSISFANVCLNWSVAARSYSMFPWLTLPDGGFFSVLDNVAEHLSLSQGSTDARCCGSLGGGWLFLVRDCRSNRRDRARRGASRRGCINSLCCCYLMNLFTKATVPLPELAALHHEIEASIFVDKIIATKAPDDASCVFAVMIHGDDQEIIFCCPGKGSCKAELDDHILDMVFYKGKLYALTEGEGLFMLGLFEDSDGKPAVSIIEQLIADSRYPSFPLLDIWGSHIVEARYLRHYLVVSHAWLLMVRRWLDNPYDVNSGCGNKTLSFEVLKLDRESSEWTELKGLEGAALLVNKRALCRSHHRCVTEHELIVSSSCMTPWRHRQWLSTLSVTPEYTT